MNHLRLQMGTTSTPSGALHEIYSARMFVDPTGLRVSRDPAQACANIYLVAARHSVEQPPLVLLADVDALGLPNVGASATNAAEVVIYRWCEDLAAHFGCESSDLEWVEYDSMAQFDRIVPTREGVRFEPLLAPGSTPRTRAAFDLAYPALAGDLMRQLVLMALTDPRHELQPLGKPH